MAINQVQFSSYVDMSSSDEDEQQLGQMSDAELQAKFAAGTLKHTLSTLSFISCTWIKNQFRVLVALSIHVLCCLLLACSICVQLELLYSIFQQCPSGLTTSEVQNVRTKVVSISPPPRCHQLVVYIRLQAS